MATGISRENEQFIRDAVARGKYESRTNVLDQAVALLRRHEELLAHVEIGTRQLREGQFTEYDDRTLLKFRDEIKTQGRQRKSAKGKRR
jgi:Arc/MetJ-type ribon-helix-helix transcriptional regulator